MRNEKLKLVIVSGKGGVGKSMLSSALAMLFAKDFKVIATDCDVDAPNLAIWLNEIGNWDKIEKISVSEKPVIDNSKLTQKEAKLCVEKCKFNALEVKKGKLKLNPFLCEGCGACEIFCPSGVVKMKPVKNGEIKTKKTKYNFTLVSGQLYPGETGSGKMVTKIKQRAEKLKGKLMLIDSAPGTGCPVIASLQDANFFKISWRLVINKWDINSPLSNKIEKWAGKKILGKISYDKKIFKAIANLTPILETNLNVKKEIIQIFNKLKINFKC